ncbi:MAG: ribulose-phosphate 3-epimerase [Erysipelotrichaceae bacterium]|nr:ribulose-phosphate 3-epimerase [Erysipelotrichaceae bacterium]
MFTVSPSIYSADLLDLRKVLKEAEGFEHIHLDIDDGNFVRGISFGTALVGQIAKATSVPLDAHLEVLNPLDHVDGLAKAGVSLISAHLEVLDYPSLFLSRVHNLGKKAGIALNLKTPVSFLEPYIGQFDQLLLVSVEADEEGLPFRRGVLKKICQARELFGPDLPVWVDGGINDGNLKEVVEAGADGVVIGRAVFQAENFREAYEHYLNAGRAYEKEAGRNGKGRKENAVC